MWRVGRRSALALTAPPRPTRTFTTSMSWPSSPRHRELGQPPGGAQGDLEGHVEAIEEHPARAHPGVVDPEDDLEVAPCR